MSEINLFSCFAAMVVGVALGIVFYGGLWFTVKLGAASAYAGLWFALSLILRLALTVGGFLFVTEGYWPRALCCLVGFIVARLAITLTIRPKTEAVRAP